MILFGETTDEVRDLTFATEIKTNLSKITIANWTGALILIRSEGEILLAAAFFLI